MSRAEAQEAAPTIPVQPALTETGVLEAVSAEIVRRLEASPLMGRAPNQSTAEEQDLLGAHLTDLSHVRRARRAIAEVDDLPLSRLMRVWPELAASLLNTGAVTVPAENHLPPSVPEPSLDILPPPLAFPSSATATPSIANAEALPAPAMTRSVAAARPARASIADRFPALRYPNFVFLWTGLLISAAGTQMQAVAVNWLALDLWHSPLALGIVSLSFALPMILLPYFGGAVADRVDRLTLLKLTQVGQMTCAGVLTVLATRGGLQLWQIAALTAISATFLAIDNPTRQAIFPDLVTRHHLMSAISLQSAAFTGAALAGPAIAGALLLHVGPAGIMFLNTISFLAVLSALFQIRDLPATPIENSPRSIGPWMLAGLAYVWRTKTVLLLLALSFVANLLGRSFVPLLAVFARDRYQVGASGYGLMVSAVGLGALLGAVGLAGSGGVRHKGRLCLISITVFCLSLEVFALEPPFALALPLLVAAGMSITLFSASIATMLQLRVPRELRGRVMSLYTITLVGVASLGALASTAVAAAISAPAAYAGGAIVLAACAALASWSLWQLGDDERVQGAPIAGALATAALADRPRQ